MAITASGLPGFGVTAFLTAEGIPVFRNGSTTNGLTAFGEPVFGLPSLSGTAYTLTANVGTVTYQGIAATLRFNRVIVATAGSETYQGIAASLKLARKVTAALGTVTYQGIGAQLSWSASDHVLTANVGSITLAGIGATLLYNRKLIAGAGSIVYQGSGAALNHILGAQALAQLYGGSALLSPKKKKKRTDEDLAVMVKTIAEDDPKGKQKLVAMLPPAQREELPDEAWEATTMQLIMTIRESSNKVQKEVERLYYGRQSRDDDEEIFMLMML